MEFYINTENWIHMLQLYKEKNILFCELSNWCNRNKNNICLSLPINVWLIKELFNIYYCDDYDYTSNSFESVLFYIGNITHFSGINCVNDNNKKTIFQILLEDIEFSELVDIILHKQL